MKRVVIVAEIGGTHQSPVLYNVVLQVINGGFRRFDLALEEQPLTAHDIRRMLDKTFTDTYSTDDVWSIHDVIPAIQRLIPNGADVWFDSPETYRVLMNHGLYVAPEECFVSNEIDPDPNILKRIWQLCTTLEKTYDNASEEE